MGSWVAKYQILRNIHPTVVHSCAPKPLQLILMQLPLQALCLTYHTAGPKNWRECKGSKGQTIQETFKENFWFKVSRMF